MCTIRLSYDQTNAKARDMLATMIDSGLFHVSEAADEDLDIDYSDPWLYEDHGDLPPLPAGKETFTPEEVRTMLMEDLREIYGVRNEVSVFN